MSADSEIQCSLPKSRSDDSKAQELHEESNFSYRRDFLLSLADLDQCKRLPSGFDSSNLCELKYASTDSPSQSYSDSDYGRSEGNLSQHLRQNPESGVLGRGAFLREPGCVSGVSAANQGSSYLLNRSEVNNASTGLSQSSTQSDSGRWDGNLPQHSQQNRKYGLLGGGTLLREPRCLAEVSAPMAHCCGYHLLNRSATPYLPPHLYKMNLNSSKGSKDLYTGTSGSSQCPDLERQEEERRRRDSFELMSKEHKAIEGKQKNVSDAHKENMDPDIATYSKDSRNHKGIINECNPSIERVVSSPSNDAWCLSSTEASACREILSPAFASISSEKGIEKKSLDHSPVQEHCNVKVDSTKSFMLSSSNLVDQFIEEEKKPESGFLKGKESDESENENAKKHESKSISSGRNGSEVYIASNENANDHESTSLSSRGNGVPQKLMASTTPSAADKIYELCSAGTSKMPPGVVMYEEIEQFTRSEVSKNHLPHHLCFIGSYDTENNQSNTASHLGESQLLALLRKGTDAIDLAAAPSKLKIPNSMTTTNLGRNLTCEPIHRAGSTKELQSAELWVGKKGSAAGLTKYDQSDLAFPVEGNISLLLVDESIRINHETATPLGCAKQTGLNKSKVNQIVSGDDVDNKIGLDFPSEQELELDPVNRFDEKANAIDEICWPDEDSLITLDDLVFPVDSMLMGDGNATEADSFASQKPADFKVRLGNERSPSSLGNAILAYDDLMDSQTCYDNMCARRSYPKFHHSHTNPGKALFHHSEVRSSDSKTYSYNPLLQCGFPINALPDLCAKLTRFDNAVMRPFSQQMLIPGEFPHQLNGLPSGAPSDFPQNDLLIHPHRLNRTQNLTLNHQQQINGGFEMPDPGHNRLYGGNSNQAVPMLPRWPWSRNV